jgi:hypothetical protein
VCASVIACCDAPPVFELGEHVLYFVALAIQGFVIVECLLAIFGWRDARYGALIGQSIAKPVAVVTAIAKQSGCLWQAGQ